MNVHIVFGGIDAHCKYEHMQKRIKRIRKKNINFINKKNQHQQASPYNQEIESTPRDRKIDKRERKEKSKTKKSKT